MLLIPSIIIESFYSGKGGIFAIIFGSLVIFFDKFILEQRLDTKGLRIEEKKVNQMNNNVVEFLNHIKSDNYLNSNDRLDEYVNFKTNYFADNEKEFRKYFQFVLYDRDDKWDKRITFMEGKYIVKFRNHRQYSSSIEKKGQNPVFLKDHPEIVSSLIVDIKESIEKNLGIKIMD